MEPLPNTQTKVAELDKLLQQSVPNHRQAWAVAAGVSLPTIRKSIDVPEKVSPETTSKIILKGGELLRQHGEKTLINHKKFAR